MNKKFLHIGFQWGNSAKPHSEVEQWMSVASDWLRYGGNSWIVYTEYDQQTWAGYIKAKLSDDDTFIVYEIADIKSSAGWMAKFVWEWINKNRDDQVKILTKAFTSPPIGPLRPLINPSRK